MQANDTNSRDIGSASDGAGGVALPVANLAEFRVLTHEGKKHAFKLEQIFWQIIQLAANARKQRMGAYVASLLETASPNVNRTSMLRSHAAEWISNRLAETTARALSPRFVTKVVQSTPLPCIAIDANNAITAHNDLFIALLGAASRDSTKAKIDKVRVSFGRDIAAVRDSLIVSRAAYIEETVRLNTGEDTLHRTARIVGINPLQGPAIGMLVMILS